MRRGESSPKAEPGLYTSPQAPRQRAGVSGARQRRGQATSGLGARTRSSGAALSGAWKGRPEAAAGPRPPSPERAESALPRGGVCPVLTLAAEPGRSSSRLPAVLSGCWTLASRPCAPLAPGAPPTHPPTHPRLLGPLWLAAARPSGASKRSGIPGPVAVGGVKPREPSLPAARERRTSESEGFLGQVAPRRWSPSRGSGWPTRSTARTSLSAATSPRPREMPPKRKRR
ncbi:hypothetical protein LEMLEM_LOCUS15904 [Lemmus lemmus]